MVVCQRIKKNHVRAMLQRSRQNTRVYRHCCELIFAISFVTPSCYGFWLVAPSSKQHLDYMANTEQSSHIFGSVKSCCSSITIVYESIPCDWHQIRSDHSASVSAATILNKCITPSKSILLLSYRVDQVSRDVTLIVDVILTLSSWRCQSTTKQDSRMRSAVASRLESGAVASP